MKKILTVSIITCATLLFSSLSFCQTPTLLKDIYVGGSSSYPMGFVKWSANRYLFLAQDSMINNPFFYVYGLWLTDGTPSGTQLLKEFKFNGGGVYGLTVLNDQTVVFSAYDAAHGDELWVTDGTPSGTVLLRDINPGTAFSNINFGPVINGKAFIQAMTGNSYTNDVWQIWVSDGTVNGTFKVADSVDYGSTSNANLIFTAAVRNNIMYFYGVNPKTYKAQFWRSDATPAGTFVLKTLDYTITQGYYPYDIATDKTVFFDGWDATNGIELWKSDGTVEGTVLVKNINSGSKGSNPMSFNNFNGKVYFTAATQSTGTELWMTNGKEGGTKMVLDIYPGSNSGCQKTLGVSGNYLYFVGTDVTHGTEPWRTNGTAAGTILLKDIRPGTPSSLPGIIFGSLFKDINGEAYFAATTYGNPGPMKQKYSLFASDGTPANTVDVFDDQVFNPYISIHSLSNVNGTCYFVPQATDQMIYKSNGTASTTVAVDLIPNQNDGASILLADGSTMFAGLNGVGIGVEPYIITGLMKLLQQPQIDRVAFNVYPNPANQQITVSISNIDANALYQLSLVNLNGEIVRNWEMGRTENTFDLALLPHGNYVLVLMENRNFISAKKIVIQR